MHAKGASTDRAGFLDQKKFNTISGPEVLDGQNVAITAPTDPGLQSTLSGGVNAAGQRRRRNANSMPRLRGSSKRSGIFGNRRASVPTTTFGIIPVVTDEIKAKIRKEQVRHLKAQHAKIDDSARFL